MRRLGTDHLDVYYAHIEDRHTSLEDTVATFASLVTEGLTRVTGCSNHAAWRVAKAREIARAAGLPGFSSATPTCDRDRVPSSARIHISATSGSTAHVRSPT
jgi:aryl-alcohol dehydrogenase-like predicted oxidoreductase